MLEELLAEAGLEWAQIDAIGVGTGPGNFTGLRISVATARGLSMSMARPAIGVSAFEQVRGNGSEAVLVSAPRDRFYLQRFEEGVAQGDPVLGTVDELRPFLDTSKSVRGTGAEDVAAELGLDFLPSPDENPAIAIARSAHEILAAGGPFHRPAPLYIRDADAAPPREAGPLIVP